MRIVKLLASAAALLGAVPTYAACPTGNNLNNNAYVVDTMIWVASPQTTSSSYQISTFSEISSGSASFNFTSTKTVGSSVSTSPLYNFSATNFATKYGATLYTGTILGSISLDQTADGYFTENILSTSPTAPNFYYTYNAAITAPIWLTNNSKSSNSGALGIDTKNTTHPGTCYVYMWFSVPPTATQSPPDIIAVVANGGQELFGQQVGRLYNPGMGIYPPTVQRIHGVKQ